MAQDLRIITTGGTFDKQYDAIKGELTFRESQLPRILLQARCTLTVHLEGPLAVDSLYMTEQQREEIAQACVHSAEDRIVIIHGTDTMCATARVIAKSHIDKTIVLTGAMTLFPGGVGRCLQSRFGDQRSSTVGTGGIYHDERTNPALGQLPKDSNKGIFVPIR